MTNSTGPGRSQSAFKKTFQSMFFSGASMTLKTITTARLEKPVGFIQIIHTHKGVSTDG